AFPLLGCDGAVARKPGPIGLGKGALQRVAEGLFRGVRLRLAVAWTGLFGVQERLARIGGQVPGGGTNRYRPKAYLREDPSGNRPAGRRMFGYHLSMPDDRDAAILAILQQEARATFADIGHRVGMAPSTVHDRVRRLEQLGLIRGYRAEVDPQGLGLFVTALVSVTPLDP